MIAQHPERSPHQMIISSRVFNFPIDLVFKAWSDPVHLEKWWGPSGFTNTFSEFDFRPGGTWRFVMHGPEKGNYKNECVFTAIERPKLISWRRISQPLFNVMVTFDEISIDETKVVFRMLFDTAAECDKIKRFAVDKNEENFDRLQVELEKMR